MRDSDLQTSISALERELALRKGYQAVKFNLPKTLPPDVADEIQTRLRQFTDAMALSAKQEPTADGDKAPGHFPFSNDEVLVLKMLISAVESKTNGGAPPLNSGPVEIPVAGSVPGAKTKASPGGASTHQAVNHGAPRKAKIITAENVRGEAKKYAAPDDELHIANPDKVDDHGMVSATHMRKGMMLKIPLDDVEFLG